VSSKQSNFFFGFEPKLNLFRLFFGLFRETKKKYFRFVSVFCTSIETTETNRINLQTTLSIRVSSKQLTFFRFEPKQNEPQFVSVVFQCVFFAKPQHFFFALFGRFGPVLKQPKQTELMVWGIKQVYILTNFLLFRVVFCLFRLFRNTETPCFDIKTKQPKQTSCFG
jgi:hypothetical protein